MPFEAAELVALALALEEDDVPEDRAVEELAAAADGSVVTLSAAHAHAVSLARALPYDEQAQHTVEVLQHALQRVTAAPAGAAADQPADEGDSWLRSGRSRRPAPQLERGRALAARLARLADEAGTAEEHRGAGNLTAELDRLRDSASGEPEPERRRSRWWRP